MLMGRCGGGVGRRGWGWQCFVAVWLTPAHAVWAQPDSYRSTPGRVRFSRALRTIQSLDPPTPASTQPTATPLLSNPTPHKSNQHRPITIHVFHVFSQILNQPNPSSNHTHHQTIVKPHPSPPKGSSSSPSGLACWTSWSGSCMSAGWCSTGWTAPPM